MFEEYQPREFKTNPIEEGQASIDKSGGLTVWKTDLDSVGIDGAVLVLVDDTTMRIGLKRAQIGKASLAVHVIPNKAKPEEARAKIHLGGAIRTMRLDADKVAGRYELMVKQETLIINLTGDREGDANDDKE